MSILAYREYKDSGVLWLGAVPAHWAIAAGRRLFRQVREPSRAEDEQLSASQKYGVIPQSRLMQLEDQKVVLALKGLSGFKHVDEDDFVISLRSFQGGIEHSAFSGCVSPAYTVLKPTVEQCPRYFFYTLKSGPYIAALQSVTDGIRDGKNISYEQFGQVRLPMPELNEQRAIAAFLDRETAKIDALVAEQERLIALLKEKRQAVISHAVTKGLDPDAPMKDSGIEWLGGIPAHWEIVKIVRLFRASKGKEGQRLTKEYCAEHEGEYPVYSGQTENHGVMGTLDRYEFDAGGAGYLFSTTVGAKAMSVSHIFGKFSLSQNCMIIRPTSASAHPRFYYYHFEQAFAHHRAMIPDHMQPSFRMDDLYGFQVAVPPVSEQIEIARYLDDEHDAHQGLISEARQAISLLKERRAALISAAVTGKIDVRGLVEQNEMVVA